MIYFIYWGREKCRDVRGGPEFGFHFGFHCMLATPAVCVSGGKAGKSGWRKVFNKLMWHMRWVCVSLRTWVMGSTFLMY